MGISYFDHQSSGKGVAKNAPQKKPFFRYFEILGRKFWQVIELNLLFVLFCLPIVTFGPAMAAMSHVMRKFILEQPCFLFDEFFTAFKKNFKQSFFIGIIDVICIASTLVVLHLYVFSKKLPDEYFIYLFIFVGVVSVFFMMHFFIYLEIVALKLSLKAIVKNAFFLVFLGVKRVALTFVINIVMLSLILLLLPYSLIGVVFFPLAWMCYTTVFICYPVIQKIIVNPYYEERGEVNPELPVKSKYESEDAVFVDRGGSEKEIRVSTKTHGKVIK
ncbi:MAG: YesL family protein [Ruminiclostridium sp.]|nr:YesL family protein [Ruminiclostridium sp.]